METADHLRTGVDAALQRRGWPRTGSAEWDFLDRTGFLVDAEAEDDPASFLAEEIRDLRMEVDAMAAERAPLTVGTPRSPVDLASRIQAELEASEPTGDDARPGLWERARVAALLFYLERTGRSPIDVRRSSSGAAPSDEA